MEPAFQRGDLLFLWNRSPSVELGEVVVYNVRGKDIPIVHRVVRTFPEVEGKAKKVKEITVYVFDSSIVLWDRSSYRLTWISSDSAQGSHLLLTKVCPDS